MVVLTGAGDKAFVAGADISEFEGRSPMDQFRVMSGRTVFDAVEAFPKPVIAAAQRLHASAAGASSRWPATSASPPTAPSSDSPR